MKSSHRIALSPNGNGGVYEAVRRTGILEDLKRQGIEYVFVYGVDNIASRICDPTFVGLLKAEGGDCGVKVVPKDYPAERVGVVATRNGAPSVVEYSGAQLLSLCVCARSHTSHRNRPVFVRACGSRRAPALQHGQHLHAPLFHGFSGALVRQLPELVQARGLQGYPSLRPRQRHLYEPAQGERL